LALSKWEDSPFLLFQIPAIYPELEALSKDKPNLTYKKNMGGGVLNLFKAPYGSKEKGCYDGW